MNPLDSVYFISVPESFSHSIASFTIDPSVLLPVELKPGEKELDMQNISWEMIISGMLKVLTHTPENEDNDYYRSFVKAVKPDIEADLIKAGIEKAKQQEFDLAVELFRTARAVIPDSLAAIFNLAQVYESRTISYEQLQKQDLAQEYAAQADRAYREAIALDNSSVQLMQSAGAFYLRHGDHLRALEAYTRLEELEPAEKNRRIIEELKTQHRLDASFQSAYQAIIDGQEDEALEQIESFIDEADRIWTAWFLKGWALRRLSKFKEAEEAFLKALSLTEPQADILNELAICSMEQNLLPESERYLNEAIRLEPQNVKIISNLGILAIKLGRNEDALRQFEAVLSLDPDDPIAKTYIEHLS